VVQVELWRIDYSLRVGRRKWLNIAVAKPSVYALNRRFKTKAQPFAASVFLLLRLCEK
jgi:hypothetical protein